MFSHGRFRLVQRHPDRNSARWDDNAVRQCESADQVDDKIESNNWRLFEIRADLRIPQNAPKDFSLDRVPRLPPIIVGTF